MTKTRLIAFYLPQFHPISENDEWWEKGFTEWTNVGSAKPLFRGHYQPKVPRDLGYYDLRVEETRIEQARLAKEAGIEGFCYWHYWFGDGKRLLERPFNEVLESGKPDFPFCLGWANHSWKLKMWSPSGSIDKVLIEQKYPGESDLIEHFYNNLKAFKDERYIKINNKPVFLIWDTEHLPTGYNIIELWNKLAIENGLEGIHFIGFSFKNEIISEILKNGFNTVCYDSIEDVFQCNNRYINKLNQYFRQVFSLANVVDYKKYSSNYIKKFPNSENVISCIYPNFDHTPRSGRFGRLLNNANPKKFCDLLDASISKQKFTDDNGNKIIFIKSWNEWGEGNYLEPDRLNGDAYIKEMKKRYK